MAGLAEFLDEVTGIHAGEDVDAVFVGDFGAPTGGADEAVVDEFGLVDGGGVGDFGVVDDDEVEVGSVFGDAEDGDFASVPVDEVAAVDGGVLEGGWEVELGVGTLGGEPGVDFRDFAGAKLDMGVGGPGFFCDFLAKSVEGGGTGVPIDSQNGE